MNAAILDVLEGLQLGPVQTCRGLTVVPIIGGAGREMAYMGMSEAVECGLITIAEVSEGGSVPNLAVRNAGEVAVLLVDGEEVVGVKQNRMVNVSVLVGARSRIVLPVSCTEAGRWEHVSDAFRDSGVVAAQSVRRKKSKSVERCLHAGLGYVGNQLEVWADIDALHRKLDVTSKTSAMRQAFAAHDAAMEECVAAMPLVPGQVGMIAVAAGGVVSLDWVGRSDVYARLHPKLVKSNAIEFAVSGYGRDATFDASVVQAFLADLASAAESEHESVGLGTDVRMMGKGVFGSALICEGEVVHLAAFPMTAPVEDRAEEGSED